MSHDSPTLTVNLDALARNYALLRKQFTGKDCAAVVKADGYGLGALRVADHLRKQGCNHFFVATLDEAIALRVIVKDGFIAVFHGVGKNEEKEFLQYKLVPVLNDMVQVERWAAASNGAPSALHVDTGMTRLGLSEDEAVAFSKSRQFSSCNVQLLMSHLACAGDPADVMNAQQLEHFTRVRACFPGIPASFANSSGVFLDRAFHFDLGRPGCSLYGITPRSVDDNPMEHVATLSAPVIQVREIAADIPVGYGATYIAKKGSRLATVAFGYADGYFRLLSNQGKGHIDGKEVSIIGRVSMDMVVVDVSNLPEVVPGSRVTFIGPQNDVNQVAAQAGTIGYEVFTRIGSRVRRVYVDGQRP